jgi:hypothetical protein
MFAFGQHLFKGSAILKQIVTELVGKCDNFRLAGAQNDNTAQINNGKLLPGIPVILLTQGLPIAVGSQLRGTPCQVFGNDLKVRTSPGGLLTYPDLTVVCGERRLLPRKNAVLLNPTAIFEILSPSTASTDQGEKFLAYQGIESLRDYVLIAQNEAHIEHFARQENGFWLPTIIAGLDASLTLSAVPLTLRPGEIYENVNFAPALPDAEPDE